MSALILNVPLANHLTASTVKSLIALLLLISKKIGVSVVTLTNVSSVTHGTEKNVHIRLTLALQGHNGVDLLAEILENVEKDIMSRMETATGSLNSALLHINGMEVNVAHKEVSAPKELTLKEITASHMSPVKMDSFGIHHTYVAYVLLEQLITVIDVLNATMIKSGFQVSDALVLMDPLILELHARLPTQANAKSFPTPFGAIIYAFADQVLPKLVFNACAMVPKTEICVINALINPTQCSWKGPTPANAEMDTLKLGNSAFPKDR